MKVEGSELLAHVLARVDSFRLSVPPPNTSTSQQHRTPRRAPPTPHAPTATQVATGLAGQPSARLRLG